MESGVEEIQGDRDFQRQRQWAAVLPHYGNIPVSVAVFWVFFPLLSMMRVQCPAPQTYETGGARV